MLASLHQEAFENNGEVWDERSLKELLVLPGVTAWVALRESKPAGFLMVRTVLDESEVLTVAVRPSLQRKGVGRALFNHFFSHIKPDVSFVYLEVSIVNSSATKFYESCNFQEIGRRPGYYSDGTEAVVMRYSLL
ncbi:GNAT family N-acetyltransferase [Acetobacteraceae bacterium ESL0709]|nr:GNAT family N-acetyltransferase [Acetobacteraceae bacterium ESL0697]MDF7678475.1 GNAT family N-acetyltransferase [Acetobacteraceae bacterium ESL0709]